MAAYESSRAAPFGAISIFRSVQFVSTFANSFAAWNDARVALWANCLTVSLMISVCAVVMWN